MRLVVFLLFLILIFVGCDKLEPPFTERTNKPIEQDTFVQYVVIEDFTGHRCGNCPRAHEKLHQLEQLYGDQIIGIALHSGFFAQPLPPNYPTDFRTPEAEELATQFGVSQWPIGMVNRTEYNGNLLLSHDSWSEVVADLINRTPKANITISPTFNNNNLLVTVTIKILEDLPNNLKMSVFLTEDSIIAAQTDYNLNPSLIPDYVHMHVFRKSFNGAWGNDIILTNKQIGDTLTRSFSLAWNNVWIKKHCNVIAFIYNITNNQIIQAKKIKLKE